MEDRTKEKEEGNERIGRKKKVMVGEERARETGWENCSCRKR